MGSSEDQDGASMSGRLSSRLRDRVTRAGWKGSGRLELMNQSLLFAALGFLALVPLLIVVAAADPTQAAGFARWLGRGLSASASAQREILELFAPPRRALRATTGFSLAALALFGLTFAATVQSGYEKVWGLTQARRGLRWPLVLGRQVLWLGFLIGLLLVYTNAPLHRQGVISTPLGAAGALLVTLLFLWASQKILLGHRVGWKALLSGAVATTLGFLGLRVFSRLVFSPLIEAQAVTYGPIGTVLIIQSWLVGVGFVVYGGALVGRTLHEAASRRIRQHRRRG